MNRPAAADNALIAALGIQNGEPGCKLRHSEAQNENSDLVHQEGITGAEMKKILVLLLAAVFVVSAAIPAFAYHHRRHHRYHRGGPPIIVIR